MGDQGEVGWACMYVETQGGLCSSRTAGCERMGDKSQQDGGLACMSRRRGDFVRLGLLDGNAWATDVNAWATKANKMEGLHVCRDA